MKRCSKCKEERDEGCFYKRSDGQGVYRSQCKLCTDANPKKKESQKRYIDRNREIINNRRKNYNIDKSKKALYMKDYRVKNIEDLREKATMRSKIKREKIHDEYILSLISQASGVSYLSKKDVPQSIIDIYRDIVKLKRVIKKRMING
jgi:Na+-translocating ferredoxin:NAD+ oxidoreductase RnfC subunit